jgi:hypothetical protein
MDAEVSQIAHAAVPAWLRLSMLNALVVWASGRADTCLHQPTVHRPEPVFATAWKPNLVACGRCVPLTVLPRGSAADRTCDCCGRVTTGIENDDGIHPGRLAFGSMVFAFGACRDCRLDTDDHMEVSAS